jgi:hypothetical protein
MSTPSSAVSSSAPCTLFSLPESLLVELLEIVSVIDGRSALITCKTLKQAARDVEARRVALTLLANLDCRRIVRDNGALLCNLNRLQRLDTGTWATGELLQIIGRNELLPELQHLAMVGSVGVDDDGLRAIAQGEARRENLRSIDITFCQNTSYQVTVWLRENLPNLSLIRRQPEWMDGRFETPFENDGIHTYYADGSFSFERQEWSQGWVVRVQPWDFSKPDHVFTKLQFSKSGLVGGELPRPPLEYIYRPGVSLLRLPPDEDGTRTVLVAQDKRNGIFPPRDYPKEDHKTLPVGVSHYENYENASDGRVRVMITRMRVQPFAENESRMPPADLVQENMARLRAIDDYVARHGPLLPSWQVRLDLRGPGGE